MAQRYCTSCGAALPEAALFCGSCGRPAHQIAAVATPEADVEVPPLPDPPAGFAPTQSVAANPSGKVSDAASTRNALIALGVVVGFIFVLIVVGATAGGQGVGVVLMLSILPALAFFLRAGGGGKDETGRVVLRTGLPEPVGKAEQTRLLEEELSEYSRDGFVRHRTDTTAQLVKPKKFSFLWALLWFLVFGIGIVVYLIYYAAKRDEGRYVEVDEYGAVRATRQVHHVL